MIRKLFLSGFTVVLFLLSQAASATPIELYECAFLEDDEPVSNNCSGLDADGLGSLAFTITGAGTHEFDAFFDFEILQEDNTYFNEYGTTGGALAAGQSWEIDEPGWAFGDIYDNFLDHTLDGTNSVPAGLEDDVSFALGWDFLLAADETATINLFLSDILDTSGFYLQQSDDEIWSEATGGYTSESVYFWSTLTITGGGGTTVPEPGTLWLLGAGLLALGLSRRRITKH